LNRGRAGVSIITGLRADGVPGQSGITKLEVTMQTNRRTMAAAALLSAAAVTMPVAAFADDKKKKMDDASVAAAVEAFRVAMHKADKEAFEKLCSDDLSYGHSAGKIETKAEFIAASTSGRSVWKTIAFNNVTNKALGDEAISRFILVGQTESGGKTNDINIGVLMVWREEDDRWKLLARQAFKL
jgi:ketosteroid isomerase-like protein